MKKLFRVLRLYRDMLHGRNYGRKMRGIWATVPPVRLLRVDIKANAPDGGRNDGETWSKLSQAQKNSYYIKVYQIKTFLPGWVIIQKRPY